MTEVVRTRAELESSLKSARGRGRVALVPTMGALHAGHRSLMQEARRRLGDRDALVVSIFVNPLQFGPGEDLDRYPRSFDADLELCEEQGVDVVFAPSVEEVYPRGSTTGSVTVDPGPLATILEGRFRPNHFRGVLTVVAKLFGLVRPDLAVFGEKDYQQLVLVRRMVADLCMPVEVVGAETVREEGGLAMSSRNAYLSEEQRAAALNLSRALLAAVEAAPAGADQALTAAHAVLREAGGVDLDYLEITSSDLGPVPDQGEGRVLVAARVGTTRLIDNVPIHLGQARGSAPTAPAREASPSDRERSELAGS